MRTFSIIIATYNAAETLQRCLDSIRQQKTKDVELIIVDAESMDATHTIINANMDIIDYFVHENDKGIYDAWNKGIKVSNGKWILFLGSDDILCSDSIRNYSKMLTTVDDETIDYISGRVNYMDSSGRLYRQIGSAWNWTDFSKGMNVAHVASLHNRRLFDEIGLFNLEYKICGDYELLLRKRDSLRTRFMNEVVAHMQIGGVSLSKKAIKEACKIINTYTKRNWISRITMASEKYICYYLFLVKLTIWRLTKDA